MAGCVSILRAGPEDEMAVNGEDGRRTRRVSSGADLLRSFGSVGSVTHLTAPAAALSGETQQARREGSLLSICAAWRANQA